MIIKENTLIKMIQESIKKSIMLLTENGARDTICKGTEKWLAFPESIQKFIKGLQEFMAEYDKLISDLEQNKEINSIFVAVKLIKKIQYLNRLIFKSGDEGISKSSELLPFYTEPLHLLYRIKEVLVTKMAKVVKKSIDGIEVVIEGAYIDGNRVVSFYYNNGERLKKYDSTVLNKKTNLIAGFHMAFTLQDLMSISTLIDSNTIRNRQEDSITKNGELKRIIPNDQNNYHITNVKQFEEDYSTLITKYGGIVDEKTMDKAIEDYKIEKRGEQRNKELEKRIKNAQEKVANGYVIPLYNNDINLPCAVRDNKCGVIAYTAAPNAYCTKDEYSFKDNKGDPVWFREYHKCKDGSFNFEVPIKTNIKWMGEINDKGDATCLDLTKENLNRIINKILKEIMYEL